MSGLTGWLYSKKVILNGSPGAGTNYQVLLKVGESSGASGCDFHVEGQSANFPSDKNQSGDLRFTANDETTLLSFWVEKVEGTSPDRVAYCWVRVTDNLDSDVAIYCFYGNSEAGNVSSGVDTFDLFEDFDPDKQDWVVLTGTWSNEAGYEGDSKKGIHSGSGTRESLAGPSLPIADFVLHAKVKSTVSSSIANIVFRAADDSIDGSDRMWVRLDHRLASSSHNGGFHLIEDVEGTESFRGYYDVTLGAQWYDIKLEVLGGTVKGYLDGDLKWSANVSRTTAGYILLQVEPSTGCDAWFDNLIIRKYTDPEPSFGSAFSVIGPWLQGWSFRKKITLNGSPGAGTNYQVLLKVGESSGASGCDFHVEGHSANFPSDKNQSGDLRFTDATGTLNFWVEKVEGASPNRVAYCWVKVADNLDSAVDIYCYYGSQNVGNVSDGGATFEFFDDFDGVIDTDKWDIKGSSSNLTTVNSILDVYISEHVANGRISNGLISKTYTMGTECVLEALTKGGSQRRSHWVFVGANGDEGAIAPDWEVAEPGFSFYQGAYYDVITNSYGTTRCYTTPTVSYSDWHKYRIDYIDTSTLKFYVDDDLKATHTGEAVPTVPRKLELGGDDYSDTNYHVTYDWIRVRKYASPAPSFSSAGSEERPSFTLTDIALKAINLTKEHTTSSAIISLNVTSSCVVDVTIRSAFFISGHVTLAKNPVEGAVVRCICQDDNSLVGTTTTDANGYYKFTGVSDTKRYHISVEYEDTEGNKYHSFSYPYIIPVSLS